MSAEVEYALERFEVAETLTAEVVEATVDTQV